MVVLLIWHWWQKVYYYFSLIIIIVVRELNQNLANVESAPPWLRGLFMALFLTGTALLFYMWFTGLIILKVIMCLNLNLVGMSSSIVLPSS